MWSPSLFVVSSAHQLQCVFGGAEGLEVLLTISSTEYSLANSTNLSIMFRGLAAGRCIS